MTLIILVFTIQPPTHHFIPLVKLEQFDRLIYKKVSSPVYIKIKFGENMQLSDLVMLSKLRTEQLFIA